MNTLPPYIRTPAQRRALARFWFEVSLAALWGAVAGILFYLAL